MKQLFLFNLLALLCVRCTADLPEYYQHLSPNKKQEIQWNQILASRYSFDYLPTSFPAPGVNASAELQNATYVAGGFLNHNDEFDPPRHRNVLGAHASVCKIAFRTYKNTTSRFTGIFETGGIGLIRFSLDGSGNLFNGGIFNVDNFAPLVAIKIYVDATYSQNLLLVKDPLAGQGANKNFFFNTLSNMFGMNPNSLNSSNNALPGVPSNLESFDIAIALLPGDALARPLNARNLGTYELASICSDGGNVTGSIVAPNQVNAVPNPAISMDPSIWARDFRKNIFDLVKEGTVIYTVTGTRSPQTNVTELIGEIVATSECWPSAYGDGPLFFRHPSLQWRY